MKSKVIKENKKIKFGKAELPKGIEDPKNHKVKITTWVDGDLLLKLREEAAQVPGGKYQALINDILRKHVEGPGSLEARLARLETILKGKTA